MARSQLYLIRPGDIVVWKGRGIVFSSLSFLLSLFDASWRKRSWKPWHMGIVQQVKGEDIIIVESIAPVVSIRPLFPHEIVRFYRWLDVPPRVEDVKEWSYAYIGKNYDYDGYIGTILLTLVKKLFKYSARVVDNEYYCWELVESFCRDFGKPLQPNNEYPLISDIMLRLDGKEVTDGQVQ